MMHHGEDGNAAVMGQFKGKTYSTNPKCGVYVCAALGSLSTGSLAGYTSPIKSCVL